MGDVGGPKGDLEERALDPFYGGGNWTHGRSGGSPMDDLWVETEDTDEIVETL